MLKTISAALLAVSVLAAPALAATSGKTSQAPVIKAEQTQAVEADRAQRQRQDGPPSQASRHHRAHKHMGALKTHKSSKVTIKHAGPATKRG